MRVSARLAAAVDAALAVDEADRPQNLEEWRAMLDRPPVKVSEEPAREPLKPPQREAGRAVVPEAAGAGSGAVSAGERRLVVVGAVVAVAALGVALTAWRVGSVLGPTRVRIALERRPLRAGESREFDGMEFAWVPAGEFVMGSASAEADDDERPLTRVRISRGYWLGRHEVTQGQWEAVMGSNPSDFDECGPNCPVESVTWDDAQGFIRSLNGRAGGSRYRLPTEAEWEYAARAGTAGDRYSDNLDAIAWHDGNSGDRTHPVGRKAPNAWGLHDMLGNVYEWVQDWYGDYPGGSVTDPRGPGSGSAPARLARGGSWFGYARDCRASYRIVSPPGYRFNGIHGFRLLRTE